MIEIEIETETIKLDQLLKFAGLVETGGQSKIVIQEGIIKVNGEVVTERGRQIIKGDIIEIEDMDKLVVV